MAYRENFPRKAINLNLCEMPLKNNLGDPFIRPYINPIDLVTLFKAVSRKSLPDLNQLLQRYPTFSTFYFGSLRFWDQAKFLFPSQKNSSNTYNYKKKHRDNANPFVDPSVNSCFPCSAGNFNLVNGFEFGANLNLKNEGLLNETPHWQASWLH